MIDDAAALVLGRLSVRALEGGALDGVDTLQVEECADALEALAWPMPDSMDRVALWLGKDHDLAGRRARRLRLVLEASGSVIASADPGQTAAVLGALSRLAFQLGGLVEKASLATGEAAQSRYPVLELLRQRTETALPGSGIGLLLVHCGAIDQADAQRGVRAGDAVVKEIGKVLRERVLRSADMLLSLSRDEFACILDPVTSEGVAILAAQKILRVLDTPLEVDDAVIAAEPSIGIALYPEHGKDAERLLQHAKAALRTARSGEERIYLYRADTPGIEFDESRYAARLRHAIHNNVGLQLFYQAQADFRTGRIIGAEALLRWNDEKLGAVPPNIAVAVAEAAGMMNELTLWVITSAIQQCAAFRALDPDFTVSINISPSNLHEPDLAQYVERALRTWDVKGNGIIFEVTETAILRDQKVAMQALNDLKRLGVGIAIDDFGTGYSSMYYLAQMPLDELKIDIMFVRQMLELPQHAKIVRSLIDLAHNLELTVVAEGVENEPIWSALKHLGCERAQGWFVGKPVPAEELAARLRGGAIALSPEPD